MAQDYIDSNLISVFPMAVNREARPTDNTLSERNLASLITSIVDIDRFVVSMEESLRFVLAGYHFEIYNIDDFLNAHPGWVSIWATIRVNVADRNIPYLMELDEGGKFQAVTLSDAEPENSNVVKDNIRTASLKLLEKLDGVWQVPAESNIKFHQNSISPIIVDIDGGEID